MLIGATIGTANGRYRTTLVFNHFYWHTKVSAVSLNVEAARRTAEIICLSSTPPFRKCKRARDKSVLRHFWKYRGHAKVSRGVRFSRRVYCASRLHRASSLLTIPLPFSFASHLAFFWRLPKHTYFLSRAFCPRHQRILPLMNAMVESWLIDAYYHANDHYNEFDFFPRIFIILFYLFSYKIEENCL